MRTNIQQLSFKTRRIPIPADYRPLYKIGHLILILAIACRGNKASLMKLHFLSWAIKSKQNIDTVQSWIQDDFKNDFHIWGISPTVNRALAYATADDIVENRGGEIILKNKGEQFFKLIKTDPELFNTEIVFLNSIGKNGITEQRIKNLTAKFF
jgi:hypothetical protein